MWLSIEPYKLILWGERIFSCTLILYNIGIINSLVLYNSTAFRAVAYQRLGYLLLYIILGPSEPFVY